MSTIRDQFLHAAGRLSTATDSARFLRMMLTGGELEGTRPLSRKTVEPMTTNHLTDRPFRAGQGSSSDSRSSRISARAGYRVPRGNMAGAACTIDLLGEDLRVVYLARLIPAGGLDDHSRLWAQIYRAIELLSPDF